MEKLLKEIDTALEITKDFNKFKHIFSDIEEVRTIAKLRRTVQQIKLKAELSKIKEIEHPKDKPLREDRHSGRFVKIRPCADEFENKTFIGIFIGDAARGSGVSIEDDKIVCSWASFNPAILIPELGRIVYGMESWWGLIKSEDDLKEITDLDIENVWYVKALKQLKR